MTERVWMLTMDTPGAVCRNSEQRLATMKTVVCWDKDSTLVSTEKRQHLVPRVFAGELTWEQYALACATDEVQEGPAALMRLLAPDHLQFVLTAADDSALDIVLQTFEKASLPVDRIIMKPAGSKLGDDNGGLKVSWMRHLQASYRVVLAVEDWHDTAVRIREDLGIPVVVLNPCYPPELEAAKAIRRGNT